MDVSGYALITGAASGIGRACALTLARDGAKGVALLDINQEALLRVKGEIESQQQAATSSSQVQIETRILDVRDEEQVNQVVNDIAQTFGRIDYIINAAGIAKKHEGGAAYAETQDWQRVIDINLTGTFFVLRAGAGIMLKQEPIKSTIDGRPLQRGSIVNLGSILGAVGVPLSTAYTASKHGVLGLTKTASEDYAKDGLRINAICPGYTETPMTMVNPLVRQITADKVATEVPMKRMGTAQEIADGIVYLCGGRSSFVTGTSLFIDGGYTQR
ncbi:hypothetical protein PV10_09191 [Exophiala mesophila]|uniref:Uncharacterized protein n=1 Tax=Exophiala mesophila TaxID=212818 RepID=A0A0D1Z2B2_EXOME|nr:uncharacterized protein PV10_09191 [Exophiala mesophila]KIV88014.1 hypothetical protein PV10_09191 [Exophiala mesophila]